MAGSTKRNAVNRESRKAAGLLTRKLVVHQDLVASLAAAYPGMPFASAAVKALTDHLGLALPEEQLRRRAGRRPGKARQEAPAPEVPSASAPVEPRAPEPAPVDVPLPGDAAAVAVVMATAVVEEPVLEAVVGAPAPEVLDADAPAGEPVTAVVEEPAPLPDPEAVLPAEPEAGAPADALEPPTLGLPPLPPCPAGSDLHVFDACRRLVAAGTPVAKIPALRVAASLGKAPGKRIRDLVAEFREAGGNPRGLFPAPVDPGAGWTEADLRRMLEPLQHLDVDDSMPVYLSGTAPHVVWTAVLRIGHEAIDTLKAAGFREQRSAFRGERKLVTGDPAVAANARSFLDFKASLVLECILRGLPAPASSGGIINRVAYDDRTRCWLWSIAGDMAAQKALRLLGAGWRWDPFRNLLTTGDPRVVLKGVKEAPVSLDAEAMACVLYHQAHRPLERDDPKPLRIGSLTVSNHVVVMPDQGERVLRVDSAYGHGHWLPSKQTSLVVDGQPWLVAETRGSLLRIVVDGDEPVYVLQDRGEPTVIPAGKALHRASLDDPVPWEKVPDGPQPLWSRGMRIGHMHATNGTLKARYGGLMIKAQKAAGRGEWRKITLNGAQERDGWTPDDGLYRIDDHSVVLHLGFAGGAAAVLPEAEVERLAAMADPTEALRRMARAAMG